LRVKCPPNADIALLCFLKTDFLKQSV